MTACARCGRDEHRVRCKQSFIEAVGALPEPPKPVHVNGARALEVMRGWGFRASIEDGQFVIEQDSVDEGSAELAWWAARGVSGRGPRHGFCGR